MQIKNMINMVIGGGIKERIDYNTYGKSKAKDVEEE